MSLISLLVYLLGETLRSSPFCLTPFLSTPPPWPPSRSLCESQALKRLSKPSSLLLKFHTTFVGCLAPFHWIRDFNAPLSHLLRHDTPAFLSHTHSEVLPCESFCVRDSYFLVHQKIDGELERTLPSDESDIMMVI